MNSLPRVTQLLSELASRDKRHVRAHDTALAFQYSAVRTGTIHRRLVEGPDALRVDGLTERPTADLLHECNNLLGAIQMKLAGKSGSADSYASVSSIRDLLTRARQSAP